MAQEGAAQDGLPQNPTLDSTPDMTTAEENPVTDGRTEEAAETGEAPVEGEATAATPEDVGGSAGAETPNGETPEADAGNAAGDAAAATPEDVGGSAGAETPNGETPEADAGDAAGDAAAPDSQADAAAPEAPAASN